VNKPYKTINEQIKLLQSRGLIIDNSAAKVLLAENYYSLINGYKDLFVSEEAPDTYKDGTTFKQIYNLFLFDRSLRLFFLPWIIRIEANLKAIIAHIASRKYKDVPEFYTEQTTYLCGSDAQNESTKRTIERLKYLRAQNYASFNHYRENVGYIPLWVLTNKMTFGDLSYFYANLKSLSLQNEIAKEYSNVVDDADIQRKRITPDRMKQFLWLLTDFRNVCAHDERFYCHVSQKVRTLQPGAANVGALIKVMNRLLDQNSIEEFYGGFFALLGEFVSSRFISPDAQEKVIAAMGVKDQIHIRVPNG